jgi:putative ABC transport system permease protein
MANTFEIEIDGTAPRAHAGPVGMAPPWSNRFRIMAGIGIRMMFHDRLKMLGTLAGVIFAVVLSNQQLGTFLGLLHKNTMFIDNADADIWVVPPSTRQFQFGRAMSDAVLMRAKVEPGVAWAEPLVFGGASVQRPDGGTEQVSVIGTRLPRMAGGPWNVVAGSADALHEPDTMLFEDSEREKLGGLNLGSEREVNGKRVRVGGFTWGLLPFGPSYAFADVDLARSLLRLRGDQVHYVLVGVERGTDPTSLAAALQRQIPEATVLTREQFKRSTIEYILTRTAIGVTFGSSVMFGLLVGFTVVSLMMFSSVLDNIREFGTLKAMGATSWDLAKLLFVQAATYATMGSLAGLAVVTTLARAIRSPQLAVVLPTQLLWGTFLVMILLCVAASTAALIRLRKLEPAMVFR